MEAGAGRDRTQSVGDAEPRVGYSVFADIKIASIHRSQWRPASSRYRCSPIVIVAKRQCHGNRHPLSIRALSQHRYEIAGFIDLMIDPAANSVPQLRAGNIRPTRSPAGTARRRRPMSPRSMKRVEWPIIKAAA